MEWLLMHKRSFRVFAKDLSVLFVNGVDDDALQGQAFSWEALESQNSW